MVPKLLSICAIIFYILAFSLHIQGIKKRNVPLKLVKSFGFAAVGAHALAILSMYFEHQTLLLDIVNMSALVCCVIVGIVMFSSLHHKLENLYLIFFPLGMASLLIAATLESSPAINHISTPLLLHIMLSVTAFSLFAIAAGQSVLLAMHHNQLKSHSHSPFFSTLPPIQTMESLLFNFVIIGEVLLATAVISGFIFYESLFEQHLVHKTFFTLLSLAIFAILIFGRFVFGWRGKKAINLTIVGCVCLMLGYFGSKAVLEVILA